MNELENIKVGDKVAVHQGGRIIDVPEVTRITPEQIITNKRKYWKKDGRQVGCGQYRYEYITPATDEILKDFRRIKEKQRAISFLFTISWRNFDNEALQRIVDAIKKEIGNSAAKQ